MICVYSQHGARFFKQYFLGSFAAGYNSIAADRSPPGSIGTQTPRAYLAVLFSYPDITKFSPQFFGRNLSENGILALSHITFAVEHGYFSVFRDSNQRTGTIKGGEKSSVAGNVITAGHSYSSEFARANLSLRSVLGRFKYRIN